MLRPRSLRIVKHMAESTPQAPAADTEVGSYFVANYPPFSVWNREAVEREALPALGRRSGRRAARASTCTSRSAASAATSATSASTPRRTRKRSTSTSTCSSREWELYAAQPAIAGRALDFVYFGGGTPSFLSTQQLEDLFVSPHRGDAVDATRRRSRSSASRAR